MSEPLSIAANFKQKTLLGATPAIDRICALGEGENYRKNACRLRWRAVCASLRIERESICCKRICLQQEKIGSMSLNGMNGGDLWEFAALLGPPNKNR